MAKVDYVKINNTINYIQNVAYLSELPVANENSADFVSVNNELYVKQVNGTTYTYAKVGGGSGGSAEPIIKTMEETETGMTITFTEDELAQIQNDLGTVVKVDMGGSYLPLSPAYSRISVETMQTQLILCCEIVEYNAWYKFMPTDDPLVFAINPNDMSNPFSGGGNPTDTAYQFISIDLSAYNTEDGEFIPVETALGVLEGFQEGLYDGRSIVLCEDGERTKMVMTQFSLSTPFVEEYISIANFKCANTRTLGYQEYMTLPAVIVPSIVNDEEELANAIKNGTYTIDAAGYQVDRTDITIFTYKGVYGGLEYTLEARPLYQKLSSGNSYQQTDLYAIVVASVGKGNTYIQNNDLSSVEDFKNIINGNYASVYYTANNPFLGNIVYKTSDSYVCEVFAGATSSNENGYEGVLKTYISCTYNSNTNTVSYRTYQNISSSVIANPKSGELNNATSGGTLTQLLVNNKVYDIASGGASEPTIINLNTYVPSTATNGTLDSSVLQTLQASDSNYIVFNNEIFKLADKQHNEGYLVYSHNGHDTTGCFFQKCITITISTRGWVLEEQENQAKLTAGSGITIENNVISSSGGGTTTDTAYVSNSTLYIEEGTTAGGGSGGLKVVEITETFVGEMAELSLDRYNEIVGADVLMYKVPIGTDELIPFLFYKNVQSGYTEFFGTELTTFTSLYNENNMLQPTLDITFTVGSADGMHMLIKMEGTPIKSYKKEKVIELNALESTNWVATDNSLKYRKADALYIVNNNNVEIVFHKMTDIPLGTSFNTTFVYFQATPPNGDGSVATIVITNDEIRMSYFTLSLDYKQPLS